jgi:DNA-binding transcriptional ArsR family regulator
MKEIEIVDDPEKIKIIIEDTRTKILRLLRFRDMTISELASILNKDVSTIFRHIKKLESAGFVKVTGERKIHNVPEKIYGRTSRTIFLAPESYVKDEAIKKMNKKRVEILAETLQSLGYEVKNVDELFEFLIYLDELTIKDLERLEKDVDWGILRKLTMLLVLLKIDDGELQRIRELIKVP